MHQLVTQSNFCHKIIFAYIFDFSLYIENKDNIFYRLSEYTSFGHIERTSLEHKVNNHKEKLV